ncbi:YdeI/OmpD-associated family protein [Nocardioides rotundus]|uniref:YdeI/OmpD-associated family protein n=1 Tax=Nocardioides rotundus TaxID=1774216 RepID=UPI001CBDEE0A|nr:YdeI/OmpD-associated family protein [Nocardioides rotundus]UAL28909.1 YdeI/OmpD-associated family protein [Nocardioides rotundus]
MGAQEDAERVEPDTLEGWSRWLADNHGRGYGVWLVQRRRAAERAWDYEESVLEALRFGWVDSTQRTLDEDRSMMWFAPRRPQSLWTQPNREHIARLEEAGLLEPAGRAAVDAARANGNWSLLEPAERGEVPDDLAAALAARPEALRQWDAFPPSARKAALVWVVTARRPATRDRRVAAIVDGAADGVRVPG